MNTRPQFVPVRTHCEALLALLVPSSLERLDGRRIEVDDPAAASGLDVTFDPLVIDGCDRVANGGAALVEVDIAPSQTT